jgi:hypothetical protein
LLLGPDNGVLVVVALVVADLDDVLARRRRDELAALETRADRGEVLRRQDAAAPNCFSYSAWSPGSTAVTVIPSVPASAHSVAATAAALRTVSRANRVERGIAFFSAGE